MFAQSVSRVCIIHPYVLPTRPSRLDQTQRHKDLSQTSNFLFQSDTSENDLLILKPIPRKVELPVAGFNSHHYPTHKPYKYIHGPPHSSFVIRQWEFAFWEGFINPKNRFHWRSRWVAGSTATLYPKTNEYSIIQRPPLHCTILLSILIC